jgi:hypothetical protein
MSLAVEDMLKDDDDDDEEGDEVVTVVVLTIEGCGEDPLVTNARRRADWEVTKARVTRQCESSTADVAIANAAFMRNGFCFWVVGSFIIMLEGFA